MRTDATRLSSKGQVVIPAWIRRELDLSPGELLQVDLRREGRGEIVLRPGSTTEVEGLLRKGYEWIEAAGVDLVEELHEARRKERLRERRERRP